MTGRDGAPAGVNTSITTTRTDMDALRGALQEWLRAATGEPGLTVGGLDRSTASGMSSVSVLFTTSTGDGPGAERRDHVLRLAPETTALPVFESYDLRHQAAVANAIADAGTVPVPRVRWVETSPEPLGRPFLIMDRAHGDAPPDNPPYVFGGPLTEAAPAQLARMQDESVELLANVHATPDPESIEGMPPRQSGADALARFVDETHSYYEWTASDGGLRVPLLERGLEMVRGSIPATAPDSVLSWGDARIGNIMYRDFRPRAALDWEGATLAPAETDVAWFVFFHRMYQDMAESFGKPGLPGFLRAGDVIAQYEQHAGRGLRDMRFHLLLAAVRMGVIFARIKARTVSFGDTPAPATADEYVLHHRMLRAIVDDEYDWRI